MRTLPRPFTTKRYLPLSMLMAFGMASSSAWAAFPVIDAGNLHQNLLTAINTAQQYTQQIEQYKTQLQQYQNMLTNTMALPDQTWSQVLSTIDGLTSSMQGLDAMTRNAGSLQAFLDTFGSTDTYAAQPCFNGGTCTTETINQIAHANAMGNASVKTANDSALLALQQQQQSLRTDASNVQDLQSSAASAKGQKAALDAANQLAAAEANQLMQIRALLVAQSTANAAHLAQENAIRAQQAAAHDAFYKFTAPIPSHIEAGPTIPGAN